MSVVKTPLRRWRNVGIAILVVTVIGVSTWQVVATRTQFRKAQTQLSILTRSLSQAQTEIVSTESALATTKSELAITKSALAAARASTVAPLQIVPFPFVDTAKVVADVTTALESVGGGNPADNPAWTNDFVNAFTGVEERQATLAGEGKPYYIPDLAVDINNYVANGTLP